MTHKQKLVAFLRSKFLILRDIKIPSDARDIPKWDLNSRPSQFEAYISKPDAKNAKCT